MPSVRAIASVRGTPTTSVAVGQCCTGREGSLHEGDAIHAAHLLWVGLEVQLLLRKG